MDDKLTAISSSNGIGGGEGSNTQTATNSRKIFADVLPHYLAMGMTSDEFYNQDHELVIAYRKGYKLERKQRNEDLWLQALYVYQAVSRVSPLFNPFNKHPKPEPYLNKPFALYDEDREEEKSAVEDKGIAYMKAKMIEINKKFGA
ncbi:MAG: hypothetical protein IKH75_11690 [Ruminococcus sp.]|nr:hypothetical protein [Ruminococcus sp.]